MKPDPTCTHGGFAIVCVVGAFACDGCGLRFVPESLFLSVAGEEHRAKKALRILATRPTPEGTEGEKPNE